MARNNSIGSLFIDIQARTAKLETDMGKVRKILDDSSKDVKKLGDAWGATSTGTESKLVRFAAAIFGAQTMVRILAQEFRMVIDHIEHMPHINPRTAASIMSLRDNMYEVRKQVQSMVAEVIAGFHTFGTAAGVGIADFWTRYNNARMGAPQLPEGDLGAEVTDLDKLAEGLDPTYWEKVNATKLEFNKIIKDAERNLQSEGNQIRLLREEAARWDTFAKSSSKNTLQRIQAEMEAARLRRDANSKHHTLLEMIEKAEIAVAQSTEKGTRAKLSNKERVEALQNAVWRLKNELADLAQVQESVDKSDPVLLERRLQLLKELAEAQRQLNTAQKKYGEMSRELGERIAQGFEEAILSGEKLSDVLRQLGKDLLQIMFRRMITNPLADALTGIIGGAVGGSAAGGPIAGGAPRIVGEFGPELIFPAGNSTVIPNSQLGWNNKSGGEILNINYHIAPGVTRAELLPILDAHGRRVRSEVFDAMRRRPQHSFG